MKKRLTNDDMRDNEANTFHTKRAMENERRKIADNMDTDKTIVIFRKFKDTNDVIALFPKEPWNNGYHSCMSYMRVGQHGAIDYNACLSFTVPAKSWEYRALHKELRGLGYNLKIAKRNARRKVS